MGTAAATPAQGLSPLALKVQAAKEEALKRSTKGKVSATVGQQKDGSAFLLFNMKDFITAIGKSDSGKTEGCTLVVNGEFTLEVEGIGEVTYAIESNSWVKARVKLETL